MSMRRFTGCALVLLGVATYQADLSGATTTAAVQEQAIEGSWNARLYRGETERSRIQISVWEDRWRDNSSMTLAPDAVDDMIDLAEGNGGDVRFPLCQRT